MGLRCAAHTLQLQLVLLLQILPCKNTIIKGSTLTCFCRHGIIKMGGLAFKNSLTFSGTRRKLRRDPSSVLSAIARLPLNITLPDPTAVSLPAQLSPLGKKPSRGPIELQADAGSPVIPHHSNGVDSQADSRYPAGTYRAAYM